MRELKEQIADKGLDQKITADLDVLRRYENARDGLAPALTNYSKQAILDPCSTGLLIRLPEKVLMSDRPLLCVPERHH